MISEHTLQCAAVDYLDVSLYRHFYFAIPNGAKRSIGCAAWMTSEGLKSGVPDLFIACPAGKYHGLFIEFKTPKGRVTDAQAAWHSALLTQGYAVAVVRTIDEFINTIKQYEGYDVSI